VASSIWGANEAIVEEFVLFDDKKSVVIPRLAERAEGPLSLDLRQRKTFDV
jgi:hypothetical protein